MADKTFDNLNPPQAITNPEGPAVGAPFPRHMHDADGAYVVVNNEEELAQAEKDGYTKEPQCNLDGTPFAKDVKAKKAASKKDASKKDA